MSGNVKRQSQTLLEAILAIGVIMTATISATTLIVSTISAGQVGKDKVVAANFAREGLEVIRGIRDTNWIRRAENVTVGIDSDNPPLVQWNSSPDGFADVYPTLDSTSTPRCYSIKLQPSGDWRLNPPDSCANSHQINRAVSTSSPPVTMYTENSTCQAGYTCSATKFRRVVKIERKTDSFFDASAYYMKVTTIITWNNHGAKTYSMSENLYDWR